MCCSCTKLSNGTIISIVLVITSTVSTTLISLLRFVAHAHMCANLGRILM